MFRERMIEINDFVITLPCRRYKVDICELVSLYCVCSGLHLVELKNVIVVSKFVSDVSIWWAVGFVCLFVYYLSTFDFVPEIPIIIPIQ